MLNHPLDLLHGARDDAYAHTHALMYFTDFGCWQRELPRPADVVLGESSALLARSLLLGDYDLAAEVLMAWPMTGTPLSPTARFGFRVLAELEDRVGFLPAKDGTPAGYEQRSGAERVRYALAAAYHTVYLMGMLCALALRRADEPITDMAPTVPEAAVAQLAEHAGRADAPWRQTFAGMSAAERAELGPLLLHIALLDSAHRSDFGRISKLLELGLQYGLANAPACVQAVELLQRVAATNPAAPS